MSAPWAGLQPETAKLRIYVRRGIVGITGAGNAALPAAGAWLFHLEAGGGGDGLFADFVVDGDFYVVEAGIDAGEGH